MLASHIKKNADNRCSSCSHLDIGDKYKYPTSIHAVRETAGKGCPSCQILLQVLIPRYEEDLEKSDGLFELVDNWCPFFCFAVYFPGNRPPAGYLELFKLPGTSSAYSNIRSTLSVSGDTSSKSSLLQALTWIDDCTLQHDHCNASYGFEGPLPHLPKRVIDVTPLDDAGSVRLVEPDEQRGLYLCLSHCWGGRRPCLTTHANILQRKVKISWTDLSKTFQDAVDFVRRIGQRFIWIDSLCILQDDHDDWDEQSIKMAEIYQNSYLTLGATTASDSTEGLYRSNADFQSMPIKVEHPGRETYTLYSRKAIVHWNDVRESPVPLPPPFASWSIPIMNKELPLLSRAWVFQERILSPRMLHFGPAELTWECRERVICECVTGKISYPQKCAKLQHSQSLLLEGQTHRAQIWRDILSEYSLLDMTKSTDCIAALQGIASQLLQGRSHKIISGLWGEDIIPNLCWSTNILHNKTMPTWFAPTWSWASIAVMGIGSGIKQPNDVIATTSHATVEKLEFPHDVQDDRAIIMAFSLELWVSLSPGCITPTSGTDSWQDKKTSAQFTFEPTKRWPDDILEVLTYQDWNFGPHYVESGEAVFLAYLATCHCQPKDDPARKYDSDYALIVRPVDPAKKKFERIGILEMYVKDDMEGKTFSHVFEGVDRTRITLV